MSIIILLLIPLAAALITFLLGKENDGRARSIALASAGVSLLAFLYAATQNEEALSFAKPWIGNFNLQLKFTMDGLSLLLVGLTELLVLLIILSNSQNEQEKPHLFYSLILLTQFSLVGVFTAGDLFLFYFFYEAALIPVYILATGWGTEQSKSSAFKMLIYTVFGSLFMLVALVYVYTKGQTADIEALHATAQLLPAAVQACLFAAFLLAFAIKMPLFPLHTWQPNAYTDSPMTATMLLSGLLSKMGVFGLLKIALPFAPMGAKEWALCASVLAIIGLIYGSIIAIKQDDMKRLVAYSSFAHMGLMAAAVFTASLEGFQGAAFQMVAHGLNAFGLFFVVKIISERTGSRSLSALGGISQSAPWLSIFFMVILLGAVALPLTNGFVGEFLMLKSVFAFNGVLGVVAGLSIIFGAVYMLRMFQKAMFGEKSSETMEIEDVRGTEAFILALVAVLVIVMGVYPNMILKISEPAAKSLVDYLAAI
ncbi:NADH-quinone oxidoreductase subunit M [Marinilongibacter aquaticus]|uniref:complex I subunit 4 family protein n=1 Tax=Marinilongibacter aquaticus TaxID=2975157 RepID=UPI0021BD3C77|nr:NADH-quinone oxidoreductase subunit M [Marinilongibacter aquaticus]UBM57839.1 NADH-quinone oxidoreductase subunit M [Marinilongibacter aquaticus]